MLSSNIWEKIRGSNSLTKFDRKIISASGDVLSTMGKIEVSFVINGISCPTDVVVAVMDIDAIIGLDFMITHSLLVDIKE